MKPTHDLHTRIATQDDLTAVQALFVDTVLHICAGDYDKPQLDAWVSGVNNMERWISRIAQQYFIIAEIADKTVGFGSLENGFYIDLLYVHKDYQHMGIATRIFSELEKESLRQGATVLKSDVSKTARSFFEQRGFRVISEQTRTLGSVALSNFEMERMLSSPSED